MEEKTPKPYSKFRNNDKESQFSFNLSALKPYLIVLSIFTLLLIIVLLIFDKILMPNLVFDKAIVDVPSLVGMKLEDGINKLNQSGLEYKISGQLYSEKYPENIILSQTPQNGIQVKEGRTIYLTISKGNQKVEVPNLVAYTVRVAKIELMKKGLQLGNIAYDFNDTFGKDTIVYQNKSVGELVPYGTEIDVVVSQGKNLTYNVPDLIGLHLEEAEKLIIENGFTLGTVTYLENGTFTVGTIFEQYPLPGEILAPNSTINIKITR
ncbi:MAG TPA: PASTA domain-containing protein [Candidatus Kapabacteria bacterium]|nr:PASTA domain-containing protein [Candidatus Kapabacteria bacterium]